MSADAAVNTNAYHSFYALTKPDGRQICVRRRSEDSIDVLDGTRTYRGSLCTGVTIQGLRRVPSCDMVLHLMNHPDATATIDTADSSDVKPGNRTGVHRRAALHVTAERGGLVLAISVQLEECSSGDLLHDTLEALVAGMTAWRAIALLLSTSSSDDVDDSGDESEDERLRRKSLHILRQHSVTVRQATSKRLAILTRDSMRESTFALQTRRKALQSMSRLEERERMREMQDRRKDEPCVQLRTRTPDKPHCDVKQRTKKRPRARAVLFDDSDSDSDDNAVSAGKDSADASARVTSQENTSSKPLHAPPLPVVRLRHESSGPRTSESASSMQDRPVSTRDLQQIPDTAQLYTHQPVEQTEHGTNSAHMAPSVGLPHADAEPSITNFDRPQGSADDPPSNTQRQPSSPRPVAQAGLRSRAGLRKKKQRRIKIV